MDGMLRETRVMDAAGSITDGISVGVLTRTVHRDHVDDVLTETGRHERRVNKLPAHVVVYFVLALAIFRSSYDETFRMLVNGMTRIGNWALEWKIPTSGAISRARERLGSEPIRLLYERFAAPLAAPGMVGSWLRDRRMMAIDGVLIDMPDTKDNLVEYDKAESKNPFPQIRAVGLGECGTRAIVAAEIGSIREGERKLAQGLTCAIEKDMLVMADRGFYSFDLWAEYMATGADLLWRVKKDILLPVLDVLPDGSWISVVKSKSTQRNAAFEVPLSSVNDPRDATSIPVRVTEYAVSDSDDAEPIRLVTTILNPTDVPAVELAQAYHHRWEYEQSLKEIQTDLLESGKGLRSKKPDLVRQELWGLFLAHYAIHELMVEAVDTIETDPRRLSFLRAVRIIRRQIQGQADFSPSGP